MKILIDNGCHDLRNMGDVAMLQVAVARLKQMWPEAEVQVITEDPHRLKKYCPDARAVSAHGRNLWLECQSNFLDGSARLSQCISPNDYKIMIGRLFGML